MISGGSAGTLSNIEQPKVKELEEELAKCRRELAEKDARMGDLRNFMLFQLKGTWSIQVICKQVLMF